MGQGNSFSCEKKSSEFAKMVFIPVVPQRQRTTAPEDPVSHEDVWGILGFQDCDIESQVL